MTRNRSGRIHDFLLLPGDGLLLVEDDGAVRSLDGAARRLLGAGSEAMVGQPLAEHWSALAAMVNQHRQSLAAQGPIEKQLLRGQHWHRLRLFRTDDGVGVGLLQKPEEAGAESSLEVLLGLLLGQVRDAVLVSRRIGPDSSEAVIVYANGAALRQTGYGRGELLGRSPDLLLGPQSDPLQRERLHQARRLGEAVSLELIQHHRDGSPCWVECDESPLPLEGDQETLRVLVLRDVTPRHRLEQASRRQEEHYRMLAESANAVVFRARPDGVTLWVSDSITALTGWQPEDLTGQPFASFVHPEDLDVLRQGEAAFRKGESTGFELRVRCRCGRHRWVAVQGRGLLDAEGHLRELMGGWRDIDACKQAERQLAASEERLRLSFEHAAIGLAEATGSGDLVAVNPAFCRFVGRTAASLLGSPWHELLHPQERAAVAEQQRALLNQEICDLQERVRWLRSDGAVLWGDLALSCLRTRKGAIDRLYVQVHDTTRQVRAEQEHRKKSDLLQATLDSLLDPHLLLTPIRRGSGVIDDFLLSGVNAAACRFHGLPQKQLLGQTLRTGLPGLASQHLLEHYRRVLETGVTLQLDAVALEGNGSQGRRFCEVRAVRVGDALSLTWRDGTERLQNAQHLAASERRFRLLAENASDVVLEAEDDERLCWISPSAADCLGWSEEDLLGTRLLEHIHPEDQLRLRALRAQLRSRGVPLEAPGNYLMRVRTASAGYRWMSITARALRDRDGAITGEVVALRDVNDLIAAQEDLHRERAELRATLDSLIDPLVILEAVRKEHGAIVDFVFANASRSGWQAMGLDRHRLIGARLLDLLPQAETLGLLGRFAETIESGDPLILDNFFYPDFEPERRDRHFDIHAAKVGDRLSVTWRDVSQQVNDARRIAESEQNYRLLADNSTDAVIRLRGSTVLWVSPSLQAMLGWSPSDWIGRRFTDFLTAEQIASFERNLEQIHRGERVRARYWMRARDGDWHWVDSHASTYYSASGEPDGLVGSLRTVDAEVAAEEEIRHRARTDDLTGLLNRREILDQIESLSSQIHRSGMATAVLFCDVDHFKTINDTYGHAVGDQVLRTLAERLRSSLRVDDLAARVGGDELIAVLRGVQGLGNALEIVEKIRAHMDESIPTSAGPLRITLSLGVTLACPGEDSDALIARADAAMYRAKQQGRDQVVAIEAAPASPTGMPLEAPGRTS